MGIHVYCGNLELSSLSIRHQTRFIDPSVQNNTPFTGRVERDEQKDCSSSDRTPRLFKITSRGAAAADWTAPGSRGLGLSSRTNWISRGRSQKHHNNC